MLNVERVPKGMASMVDKMVGPGIADNVECDGGAGTNNVER